MNRCRWCDASLSVETTTFCSTTCARAAAEMPELLHRAPAPVPTAQTLAAPRRRAGFFLGAVIALSAGSAFYAITAPSAPPEPPAVVFVEQVPPMPDCVMIEQPAPRTPSVDITVQSLSYIGPKNQELEMYIEHHAPAFVSAYQRALQNNPELVGDLRLGISFDTRGDIDWVSRLDGEVAPNLESEFIRAMHKIRLPATVQGGPETRMEARVIFHLRQTPVPYAGSFTINR